MSTNDTLLDELDLAFYDYTYPKESVAQAPVTPRDASRLMHVPAAGECAHLAFRDLPKLLKKGDLLVINETRVIKARLRGVRTPTGGNIQLLILGPAPENPRWMRVLSKPVERMREGATLNFHGVEARVIDPGLVEFPESLDLRSFLALHGEMPLPPYIKPPEGLDADTAYQPVFARIDGSIAAPTASLHFTDGVLSELTAAGVSVAELVLEIGLGTFAPVRGNSFRNHVMHEERYEVPPETVAAIERTRAAGGRIVAVGTTVVRALESQAKDGTLKPGAGATRLFITPGFRFNVVDAMVTNFHVPRSTLLALVCAFAGRKRLLAAYEEAVRQKYRLFSFGDAMLLERAA